MLHSLTRCVCFCYVKFWSKFACEGLVEVFTRPPGG